MLTMGVASVNRRQIAGGLFKKIKANWKREREGEGRKRARVNAQCLADNIETRVKETRVHDAFIVTKLLFRS